jgi:glycosyltransferase involved in cell wall biosynthesis
MGYATEPNDDAIADAIVDYYENDRQEDYTQYLILEKEKYSWSILTKAFVKIKDLIDNI